MLELSELQQDILTEAFNLGMGVAAASLSEMVDEEVGLSVPELSFLRRIEAVEILAAKSSEHLSGVTQSFTGPFSGNALLLFPVSNSLELVRLLLQDSVPTEQLTELEEEALCEIGNIILNAGLSSLADLFGHEIRSSIPSFCQGSSREVLAAEANEEAVLFLRVDFRLERYSVDGYVVFLLDVGSLQDLAASLDRYLAKLGI